MFSLKGPSLHAFLGSLAQGFQAFVGLAIVPILIGLIGAEDYGLWVTLVSVINWIGMFDFGIGYGLRNRITASISNPNVDITKDLVNTLRYYTVISIFLLVIFIFILVFNEFFRNNWVYASIIYFPVILLFPTKIATQILQGVRKVHFVSISNFLKSFLWLLGIAIYATIGDTPSNLFYLAIIFSLILITHQVILCLTAFNYSGIKAPRFGSIFGALSFTDSIRVGLKFFVLQISSVLLFSIGNYLIYNNLTGEDTAVYDTVNKLFLTASSFFNILINVYWSEISYHKSLNASHELKAIYRKLFLIVIIISLVVLLGSPFVPWFVSLWTGGAISVNRAAIFVFSSVFILQMLAYIGAVFLNAFEKMKPQLILALSSICLIFPFVKIGFYLYSNFLVVPIVTGLLILPSVVVCNFYALKLVK